MATEIKRKRGREWFPPATRKRMIDKAKYSLFVLGLSQKETAGIIGISTNSMSAWVKALGWTEDLKNLDKVEVCKDLKFKDSLSGFMVYLKKKHPTKYKNIYSTYKAFIDKH